MLAFFTQNMNAQKEEKKEVRKMTIITKTIDEDGNETVTKTVKEGDEVSDEEIDKIIQEHTGGEIDVEVDMEKEGTEKIIIKEKGEKGEQKQYRIIKETQEIEVESDEKGEMEVIVIDGDDDAEGEHKIKIIKKGENGEEEEYIIKGNKDSHKKMMFISEDGDVQEVDEDIQIIKKKSADGKEMEVKVITGGDSEENTWTEKAEGKDGEVIIVEIETTEEIEEDGKVKKKKTKKIKKTKKVKKEKY